MIIQMGLSFLYHVRCLDKYGNIKWEELFHNLTTTEGANSLGNVYFRAQTQITAWYVGLKQAGTIAAGDTAASHAGWSDFTGYSQSTRPALTLAAFSGGGSDNSASKAEFTINASGTVAGAFIVSNSSKTGNTGVLYSVGDFSAAIPVVAADTIQVTASVS